MTWRRAFAVPICAMVIVIMLIQRVDYGEGDGMGNKGYTLDWFFIWESMNHIQGDVARLCCHLKRRFIGGGMGQATFMTVLKIINLFSHKDKMVTSPTSFTHFVASPGPSL